MTSNIYMTSKSTINAYIHDARISIYTHSPTSVDRFRCACFICKYV